ncbi:maltose-6'-phosphate glucosidase [Enterococcus sp. BWT-B8]|uniref:family 4 glycosyl hydrolase n=1 Tax=unclassified Enterococcus TaxID=2608891 RepID=UPI001E3A982E|nr:MULTISPECIES: maltose-6'-phosphate glucosidase [unclassified Enterococcus]MCB5952467.1 maltose-6'-phosphate glucosidase [Enterococcus sp. BWT-B8]MCB5953503.1 maltose-6'-phosphate glucosidase [Enterococcus sp. CWB-B31]
MSKKQIITIAGGGSTYTPGIIQAVLNNADRLPISEIRLYDIDKERNEDMYLIIDFMLKKEGHSKVKLVSTEEPQRAFTGCDFIFSQIRVGGMKMREKDEKIALKYDLVGQETCGLGGFAYGMRSMRGLLEIVGYVQQFAPEAWILNYTNPESIVSEAVRRQYPEINMINACDMTISIEETIADNYGYNRKEWVPGYYGLNHFGWYTEIYDKSLGRDVMPEIIEKLKTQTMKVADFNAGDQSWQEAFNMMSVITKNFPTNIPNNYLEYYLYPDMVVEHADKNYTRANMVMDGREKNTKEMAEKIRLGVTEDVLNFNFGEHGQYIVDMATSILNDEHRRFMLIVPNQGAIPNLRSDAVVEVPAYVGATGAEPVSLRKPICDFHKGLMEAQVAAEKLLVDAYFEGSYQKALQAFTLNQTVPNARVAKLVLDEMIEANKDYWPTLA